MCTSPAQHAAALLASLDPSIVKRQNTGVDSEELQRLQVSMAFAYSLYPVLKVPSKKGITAICAHSL